MLLIIAESAFVRALFFRFLTQFFYTKKERYNFSECLQIWYFFLIYWFKSPEMQIYIPPWQLQFFQICWDEKIQFGYSLHSMSLFLFILHHVFFLFLCSNLYKFIHAWNAFLEAVIHFIKHLIKVILWISTFTRLFTMLWT